DCTWVEVLAALSLRMRRTDEFGGNSIGCTRGLAQSGALPGITVDQVDRFLKQGVNRLLSMQTSEGGFGYWPGDHDPSWWGSMYAISALTLAGEGGFDVPKDRIDKAVGFLRTGLF